MAVLEIIRVRAIRRPERAILDELMKNIQEGSRDVEGLQCLRFLENSDIETDLAVALTWRSGEHYQNESPLTHLITMILGQFGQVDESVWKDI